MLQQYTNFTIISTGVFRLTYLERSHGDGMTEISNRTAIQLHTEPDWAVSTSSVVLHWWAFGDIPLPVSHPVPPSLPPASGKPTNIYVHLNAFREMYLTVKINTSIILPVWRKWVWMFSTFNVGLRSERHPRVNHLHCPPATAEMNPGDSKLTPQSGTPPNTWLTPIPPGKGFMTATQKEGAPFIVPLTLLMQIF